MRAMWSGAVSFGLVSVPVRVYSATTNHDIRFHQVHGLDGGRIRYKRFCTVCETEVEYADIVKGHETDDGQLITLTEDDLTALPVNTSREIEVVEFVPADQVDPLVLDKAYYLEPETRAAKPYALLREALRETDRMAVVKLTLRQKESLAVLRVRDQVIVLQTLLWPDEVREPDFEILDAGAPELRPQEMQMAASLIDSLSADFDPGQYTDGYREAVAEMIEHKRKTGESQPTPVAAPGPADGDSMSDLLAALEASVAAAKGQKPAGPGTKPAADDAKPAAGAKVPAQRSSPKAAKPARTAKAAKAAKAAEPSVPAQRPAAEDAEPAAAKPKPRTRKPAARKTADKSEVKTPRRTRKPA
jgi:DNA end-binding protein Ku